jgi:hypothetical protein
MLTAGEARAKRLEGCDTLAWSSHGPYIDDINLASYVVSLNTFAYELFAESVTIRRRDSLLKEARSFAEFGSQSTFERLRAIYMEHFRFGTAFELQFKASLILNGNVVHEIDGKLPAYEELSAAQKTRPVRISEMQQISGFRYDSEARHLVFPGLSERSLSFGILKRSAYKAELGKTEQIYKVAEKYQKLRNHIHLPGDLVPGRDYKLSHIKEELELLITFINADIVHTTNDLVQKHSLPQRNMLRPI